MTKVYLGTKELQEITKDSSQDIVNTAMNQLIEVLSDPHLHVSYKSLFGPYLQTIKYAKRYMDRGDKIELGMGSRPL